MTSIRRRALTAGMLGAAALPTLSRAQGRPIRIGGTLTLTGPLAAVPMMLATLSRVGALSSARGLICARGSM